MLINGVPYLQKQIKLNITPLKRKKSDIKAIVVHYTGNPGASANNHFDYWNNTYRGTSADIVIDKTKVLKINDWYKNYTWHIGDGHGKYGYWNNNVIGIEMCIEKNGKLDPKTISNTIAYIRYLIKNGFTENVIRHYDASRKLCPPEFIDLKIKGHNKAYKDFRSRIFAKDTANLYENYHGLYWLYKKGFITGKEYMTDKEKSHFDCNQIGIIMKRIYEDILRSKG
jgi:N-acetylmuramoyl-L-alanine amidase CwlA